ncbi:hypothetical protein Drorol1_Dr00004388 [Drosera rotundifolia]
MTSLGTSLIFRSFNHTNSEHDPNDKQRIAAHNYFTDSTRVGRSTRPRASQLVRANYGGDDHNSTRGVSVINVKPVNGCMTNIIETAPHIQKKIEIGQEDADGAENWMMGKLIEGGSAFRQNFFIRSYEIGPDKTVNLETIMNFLQDAALNQMIRSGVAAGNAFGYSKTMSLMKLIWVVTRIHIQINKDSSWGDVLEVDTWFVPVGKYSYHRDWTIRDRKTQQIVIQATCTYLMIDTETRKCSKIPDHIREELKPSTPQYAYQKKGGNIEKINKLTDEMTDISIRSNLVLGWSDLDLNQHVNNVKYLKLIMQSVPADILRDYSMRSITLEYRRECTEHDVIESLTSVDRSKPRLSGATGIESTHLLRIQDNKAELVRARMTWQSRGRSDISTNGYHK